MPVNIFTTIDDPLATNLSFAEGINDTGLIVGQFRDASNHLHGYLLSGGSFITLDDPAATNGTVANGINNLGEIGIRTRLQPLERNAVLDGAAPEPAQ